MANIIDIDRLAQSTFAAKTRNQNSDLSPQLQRTALARVHLTDCKLLALQHSPLTVHNQPQRLAAIDHCHHTQRCIDASAATYIRRRAAMIAAD